MMGSCMAKLVTLVYSVVPFTVKLPVMIVLPATLKLPPVLMLPPVIVPVAVSALVLLLNVKLAVALAMPESLNTICVLEPGAD